MDFDNETIMSSARSLLEEAVDLRRALHRRPELGLDLPVTKAAVLAALGDEDVEIRESARTSGLVVTLTGAANGPTILLRGDMDALPLREDTGLAFSSEIDGAMHACGHDAHTAMLAMAVKLLVRHRDALAGNVTFMFQPGEEGFGGAKVMLDEGLLDGPPAPQAAFALHISPNHPSGTISLKPGPMLAAADFFNLRVVGRGGHASMPHLASDPIPVACELVGALQTWVTRRIPAFDPVVLTVARIQSGTTMNVIPEAAEIEGTLRSFSARSRDIAVAGLTQLTARIAAAHGLEGEAEIREGGYPPTINDDGFAAFVADTARDLLGDHGYQPMRNPLMGAEDFSYVLQRMPGAMAMLGVAPEGVDPRTAPACHSNRMVLDEAALLQGIAMHAAVARNYLRDQAGA